MKIAETCLHVRLSIFTLPGDNFSECQWILTKLGMCIGIVEIWFVIEIGNFCQSLTELYLPMTCLVFHFWTITLVNVNGFSPNLVCALIL